MHFRILGPLAISDSSEPVTIAGPRQQTVIAMLLLESDHVVPVDRLIRAVWDEDPPTTAREQIQISISALRRQMAADDGQQIITSRPGYVLKLDAATLDSREFEARVAGARRAVLAGDLLSASAEFREAASLWRGQALEGIESRLVQQIAAPLNERRLSTLEECLECELRLGLHQDVAGQLSGLVREYPLRERLRALLMEALYGAGRQAEALEAYREARRTLIEELGIEPGKELQQVHQAILSGEPVAGLVAGRPVLPHPRAASAADQLSVPRLLPATIPDFTGRARLVDRLIAAATDADVRAQHAVPVSIIVGQGGAGKTTLAVHVGHRVAAEFSDGQLFARLRMGDHPASLADVLERFLRVLGVGNPMLPDGVEERAELYRNVLAKKRMLIVLDDATSEQQVAALLPGAPECSVIVTSRRRLTGIAAASRFELSGFSPRSAVELLSRVVGADRIIAEPQAAASLCELSGYLPLALRIVGARLAARPHWSVSDLVERLADESGRLDELNHGGMGVRAGIAVTYESLSPQAQQLFRRLAVSDAPSFASWVSAPLLEMSLPVAQEYLEELAEAYLLDAEPSSSAGQPRYRFHDMMRPFARERLAAEESAGERRGALERLLGAMLYLTGEAHRREYGGDFLLPRSGASRWPLPDPLVTRLMEAPLAWYEQERQSIGSAVRQAAAAGFVEHSWDLALTAVALYEAHGHFSEWRETHETALKAACRADDRWGEAAMRYSLGSLYMFEQRNDAAAQQFALSRSLYGQLGDRYGTALVLRNLAYLDRVNGNLSQALERWEDALGTFQVLGDRIAEAHVLHNLAQVHMDFRRPARARELLDRADDICAAHGNRRVAAQVVHRSGELHLREGELGPAETAFRRVLTTVRESGDLVGESYALLGLGKVQLRRGDAEAALRTLDRAQELADTSGELMVQSRVTLARAQGALAIGELDDAGKRAADAASRFEEMRAVMLRAEALLVQGQVELAAGRPDSALAAWHLATALLAGLNLQSAVDLSAELAQLIAAAVAPDHRS